MVPTHVGSPSVRNYQKGCRCPQCRVLNTAACQDYRERRKAFGQPLTQREMPTLITRLRREIGYPQKKLGFKDE